MNRFFRWTAMALAAAALVGVAPATATDESSYRTSHAHWRASEQAFSSWTLNGVSHAADGSLRLDPATASSGSDPYPPGGYLGGNFYNGGSFVVGEAMSPVVAAPISFSEAIASWNAQTPLGSWLEVQMRARTAGHFTKYYNLGVWAADSSTVQRHSVRTQGDADGFVAVDTLILDKKHNADAYQLKVRLFSADASAVPALENAFVVVSTSPGKIRSTKPGDPSRWNTLLAVPECSQMVYPDGGTVWCSPTSTSMVMAYWTGDTRPCEPGVRAAVDGVFDWVYDGHGNWPFNTAYAATAGLEAHVARFTSLADAEKWVAAGVPVVISYWWKKSSLTGAPIPSSDGHLAVLVGFDGAGNPIVNDPAAATDAEVQRTYLRAELEDLWISGSGGTAYLIYPTGFNVPTL